MTVTDWIQAVSSAINAALVLVLVIATIYYARKTAGIADAAKAQADASVRMAKEMEKTRAGYILPIIDIVVTGNLALSFDELYNKGSHLPKTLKVSLKNAGMGHALNLKFCAKLDYGVDKIEERQLTHLPVGATTEEYHLVVSIPEATSKVLGRVEVKYEDAYGNPRASARQVSFDRSSGATILGPLQLTLAKETEQ